MSHHQPDSSVWMWQRIPWQAIRRRSDRKVCHSDAIWKLGKIWLCIKYRWCSLGPFNEFRRRISQRRATFRSFDSNGNSSALCGYKGRQKTWSDAQNWHLKQLWRFPRYANFSMWQINTIIENFWDICWCIFWWFFEKTASKACWRHAKLKLVQYLTPYRCLTIRAHQIWWKSCMEPKCISYRPDISVQEKNWPSITRISQPKAPGKDEKCC